MASGLSNTSAFILASLLSLHCGQAPKEQTESPTEETMKSSNGQQHPLQETRLTLDYLQGRWEYRVDGKLGFGWVFVGNQFVALGEHAPGDSVTVRIKGTTIYGLAPGVAPVGKPAWHPFPDVRIIAQDTMGIGVIEEMRLVRVRN